MRKLIFATIIILSIAGCSDNKKQVRFEIQNDNNLYITDISISNGVNEVYIDTLKLNKSKTIVLKFIDVPKVDGGYKLSYVSKSKNVLKILDIIAMEYLHIVILRLL